MSISMSIQVAINKTDPTTTVNQLSRGFCFHKKREVYLRIDNNYCKKVLLCQKHKISYFQRIFKKEVHIFQMELHNSLWKSCILIFCLSMPIRKQSRQGSGMLLVAARPYHDCFQICDGLYKGCLYSSKPVSPHKCRSLRYQCWEKRGCRWLIPKTVHQNRF